MTELQEAAERACQALTERKINRVKDPLLVWEDSAGQEKYPHEFPPQSHAAPPKSVCRVCATGGLFFAEAVGAITTDERNELFWRVIHIIRRRGDSTTSLRTVRGGAGLKKLYREAALLGEQQ